jgi:hypothetical protein
VSSQGENRDGLRWQVEANSRRLDRLEGVMSDVPVLTERMAELSKRMDRMNAAFDSQRTALWGFTFAIVASAIGIVATVVFLT